VSDREKLFLLLADAVVAMKPGRVAELARQVIAEGISAEEAITRGLAAGMRRMGEKYAAKECFVPEVLVASRAMYAGFEVLRQHVTGGPPSRGRVILGVVEGDLHDIGKNIVKVMAQAAGFEVVDLGRNVKPAQFVQAAEEAGACVVGMSALMTTTMVRMGGVVAALDKAGLRRQVKIVVGGAPVSAEFSRRVGADGYAADAHGAVLEFERLTRQ